MTQITALPHWAQNFAPIGMTLLHFVHDAGTSDVPHWPQKRAPCGLITLHFGQVMPLAEGAGLRPQS
jgi:hypothetical protein